MNPRRLPPAAPGIVLLSLLTLSGCMLINPYALPDGVPTARVRVASLQDFDVRVSQSSKTQCFTSDDRNFRDLALLGSFRNSGLRGRTRAGESVGIPLSPDLPPLQKAEFEVEAGKPFALYVSSLWSRRASLGFVSHYCAQIIVFTPAAGLSYEAVFSVLDSETSCTMLLSRIEASETGEYRRVPESGAVVLDSETQVCP